MSVLRNAIFLSLGLTLAPVFAEPELQDVSDSRNPSTLITNGQEASPGQFPWQAAIYIDTGSRQAFCGGSLISDSWVLTAAHCVQNMKGFKVVLGAHRLSQEDEAGRQVFQVNRTSAHIHPRWSRFTLRNDIALLPLPTKAILSDKVSTIQLSTSASDLETTGTVATVSGWGLQSDKDNTLAENLQFISQPIITNSMCNLYYLFRIQPTHICISGVSAKSTCQGDSGGPLVVEGAQGGPRQVGIVSFGIALGCEVGWPAVFTRVSSYLGYVSDVTGLVF